MPPLDMNRHRPDPGAALMLRFQAGEAGAFEEMVRAYQDTVYAFLFRFRGREDGVEDLAQEVFLRVFRARERYRPDAKFSTWLYRIVCNLCINEKRDRKDARSLDADSAKGEAGLARMADEKAEQPSRSIEQREIAQAVRASLEKLPENQRAAVLLSQYHGMSYRDVGESLGVSEKAVKSMMARAREQLKEKLLPFLREEVRG